jgi:sulfur-carrier protein
MTAKIFRLALSGPEFSARPWCELDIFARRPPGRAEALRHGGGVMTKVLFTANIQRHVGCPEADASGSTVRDVLDAVFADNPQARSYVLDDQAALRKHMTVFVDGRSIRDRVRLSDAVTESSTIHVFQALSGG